MLEKITSTSVLKTLTESELYELSGEIRKRILDTVSENGGHLSSNLGMVEATVAIHRVFDSPSDKIIFDVGHQCYTHKLLTGRNENFGTLRRLDGISGFPNRDESEHDAMTEGHSGTSVSAALGMAEAAKLKGGGEYSVAVVGDGSLTNGMIYEALNNCAGRSLRLIIIINDNEMSISRNIGGLHNYLNRIRISKGYFKLKHRSEHVLDRIPVIGKAFSSLLWKIKNLVKRIFVSNTLFEDLGIEYLGPVNGENIGDMCRVLEEAKNKNVPCVVHMITKKGSGYAPAEEQPDKYHAVHPFDAARGLQDTDSRCFSSEFGEHICKIAEDDKRICAITAAMCDGTGLRKFSEKFPERFFDVGIAEEHAVTFAAGLAAGGMRPVLAVYSTFAQRCCDQFIHDISIQKLPLTVVLDRAGLVANDGITHQGIFDYPLISSVPDSEIYCPETYAEMKSVLDASIQSEKLSVVRIPRGSECRYSRFTGTVMENRTEYTDNIKTASTAVITAGRLAKNVNDAVIMTGRNDIAMIRLVKTHPLDFDLLSRLLENVSYVYVVEEGCRTGGYGEKIAGGIRRTGVTVKAIDGFVRHGDLKELDLLCGFSAEQICADLVGNKSAVTCREQTGNK